MAEINTPDLAISEEQLIKSGWDLNEQSLAIPEIAENQEAIEASGRDLIEHFNISPEFFDDKGRSLIFTSIASRWSKLEDNGGDDERVFLTSSLAILANKFSPDFSTAVEQISESENDILSQQTQIEVYDSFTDAELTKELSDRIANGLLDGVKARLGITDTNEDLYEVRVLNVGDEHGAFGLAVPKPETTIDKYGNEIFPNSYFEDLNARGEWIKGLEKRTAEFREKLGGNKNDPTAPAWVTRVGDKTLLCMPMPLAEKILHPDATEGSSYWSDDDRGRDFSILEHEYTHTQGGVNLERGTTFGIGLEELRAEHFSGDNQGYQDIKGFYNDLNIISGTHVAELFDNREKGGTAPELYTDIASIVGIDMLLEVIETAPTVYNNQKTGSHFKDILDYLGGFDGVTSKILEKAIDAGDKQTIEDRLEKKVKKMLEITENEPDFVLNYRKNIGLNTITDLMQLKATEILDKKAA
ncbi:MAG: hypothetical protein WCJ24_01655 [Candidatus Saccharibacteria bacterium]